jgi:methyl-accepting chemotaxis protein
VRQPDLAPRPFALHLLAASLSFALVLELGVGAAMFARWVVSLDAAPLTSAAALEASAEILALHERFWPVAGAGLLAVALAAAWITRRITGPLVRFTQAFDRLRDGGFPEPLRIRATDYLVREVQAFNSMVAALKARATEVEGARAELSAALEELSERVHDRDADALAALAGRALELVKILDGRVPGSVRSA